MIKKITAVITALAILASLTAFASFYDVDENGIYAQSVERLVRYGVLSGKGDGYFDPDAGLTRAELAKIATVIAGLDSLAAANTGTSLYSDMPGSHWASGYVNVAAKNQLILGYPDGTYAPEKSLTFAESVTVLLRLLGYTAEDLGDNWPSAYTAKAAELGVTSGMRYGDYDLISRADMALAADRALLTDMDKNDGEAGKKLIQRMDYTITDCIILATSKESKNLLSDEVSTTAGTYQKTDDSVDQYVTRRVKLVLNRDGKVVNVMPIAQTGGEVVIQGVIGTEIVYAANGVNGSMKLDDTSIVYHQGAKKTLSDIKGIMETGMTMAVYFSANGSYDYSVVKDFDMLGPVVVTADFTGGETSVGGYALNSGGLRVIRDGYGAQLSEIKAFDVVYYNTASNILYAYCDKVAGVYEKAYPNKAGVTKITLSGVEYELESQDAVQLFGEYPGAYKINDYMTILLGRDGKVAGAVNMNAADLTAYGVILSCGERISEEEETKGTKENFVNVFTVSGTEQEFKTDKDYTAYRGRVIKYQFSGGLMIPQFVTPRRISGKVDAQGGAIGDYRLTDGAAVVDLSYIPEQTDSAPAVAKLVELSDVTAPSLTEEQVIYALLDPKFGDIQFIVLNNVTMARYQFGIITGKNNTTYDIDFKGSVRSYGTKVHYLQQGQAVMASIQNGAVTEIKAMAEVQTKGAFAAADTQRIKVGTTTYTLASDAVAYLEKDFKFLSVSVNELSSRDIKSVRLFSDKTIAAGGLVRIIVFTE